MFALAILIGIYSYIIYSIGLSSLLYKQTILVVSALYTFSVFYFLRKRIRIKLQKILENLRQIKIRRDRLMIIFFLLIASQVFVNLIGVMGPELGFDALWYHLMLPKIFLSNHSISFIPGGLLYYSVMPKLTEMLYMGALTLSGEILAKIVHFSFGILSLIALYKLSRSFFSPKFALLGLVILYSNLVIGWLSISAYIDLARTFFEIMALWGFINWREREDKKWFFLSAIMMGLAISTKLLAIGSLLILSILIIFYFLKKKKPKDLFIGLFAYWFICLLIPLPWFLFSYFNTGNPVYPFFSNTYPVEFNFSLINPLNLSDPINPLYIILVPIGLLFFDKQEDKLKMISSYSILGFVVWQLTPNTGGGRFILPYLPAFSLVSVWVIREIWKLKIRPFILGFVIFFSLFSTVYRLGANLKYIPVIVGAQTKSDFLTRNLNFSFGDFYDTDGFFKKTIKKDDAVLLYGFHNVYYIDFPFIDSSFVKKGDKFNYIAVQNSNLPKRFSYWNRIYYNSATNVKLYSLEGQKWDY